MRKFTVIGQDEVAAKISTPTAQIAAEDEEKVPLFWKLFGGSVFSIIVFLILAIFGYVVTGVQTLQESVNKVHRESVSRAEVTENLQQQRDKVGGLEIAVADLKEKNKEGERRGEELRVCQEKLASIEKLTTTLQSENKELREQVSQLRERLAKLEQPAAPSPAPQTKNE